MADLTIPGDDWVSERKAEKIEKYKVHKDKITRIWSMKEVILIPVVAGALGAISTGFEKYIAAIGIEMRVENAKKNSFFGDSKDFETGTWMLRKKPSL